MGTRPAEGTTRRPHAATLTWADRPGGARYQRKLDTLAALRHAALRLALDRGVEAITVADIATSAGVSRRTFFNYFATKEDALVGETPLLSAFLRDAIAARPDDESPLHTLESALQQTLGACITEGGRERIRARHQLLAAHPELIPRHLARYAAFEQLLADALAARANRHGSTGTDLGLAAALVATTVRLCLQRWAEQGDPPLSQRLTAAFATLHHGLGRS